uniref:Uncharacterized protein n=1 Tax=Avena sativa TaxID=4498 RepID=A0ACD5TRF4_AVESA
MLYLQDNSFSGMIPVNLSSCSSMTEMGLHNNKLRGHIPAELGEKLMSLRGLLLGNNSFTGPIPASLGNLSHLQYLDLSDNELMGAIPPGLGNIRSMRHLELYKNKLSGTLPSSLYNLSSLEILQYSKSFEVECEAMRRIRHRSLIKIITSCSSINHQGQEFKALVYEFMPNGNLDGWLHPKSQEPTTNNMLSLAQRLDIAVDIVDAVEYLHNYCQPLVIHCDLKPSNILLAEDMSARVGDFGISRILQENTSKVMQNSNSTIGIRGSIGYVAPVIYRKEPNR